MAEATAKAFCRCLRCIRRNFSPSFAFSRPLKMSCLVVVEPYFSSKPVRSSSEHATSVALDFDMISLLGRASWRWLSRLVRLLSSERASLMPFDLDRMICKGFELSCVFIAFFSQLLRHSLTAARTTMSVSYTHLRAHETRHDIV